MKPLLKNWLSKNNRFLISLKNTALSFRRKGCIFLYSLLFSFTATAQNLVPNPSFEIHSACPNAVSQISNAIPWNGTNNSTDYFNGCAPNSFPYVSVPNAGGGFQLARTGVAYAGIIAGYGADYREYLQVQLTDTLTSFSCYKIIFYLNLHNLSVWGINNIGACFTATNFTTSGMPAPYSPHILKFENNPIIDTLDWTQIAGIYLATGNEKFITIGNFENDINTETDTSNANGTSGSAYYYIDDVSVIPIDSIPGGMPAFAGNDTTIIAGNSVFIGQEITNLVCNWYVGSTLIADSTSGIFVSPTSTTTYTVEQFLCGTITYDTVTVYVSGVGVEENSWSQHIHLFPNPSNGNVNLQFEKQNTATLTVQVFNLTGELLYKQELEENKEQANFSLHLANGIYFVHITNTRTNEQIVKKLVIQQ